MVRTGATEPKGAEVDLLALLRQEQEQHAARLAEMEQRLAALAAPCERCARLAPSLDFFAGRLREEAARNQELERERDAQAVRIETLTKRVAELEQRVHRSAAPFRRPPEQRQPDPRPPGRAPGHPGGSRPAPSEPLETEAVPLPCCPHCLGPVTSVRAVEQVIAELPPQAPLVRRVVTYTGQCAQCGAVRSRHPFQTSTATGAAGVQLGPHALAVAADLRHGHGLTLRRVCAVLAEQCGLTLSPGGLYHALARMAEQLRPEFAQLQAALRASPSVHVDETGWWVEHQGGWLWVFTTPQITLYRISRKRSQTVLQEVLGERYEGVLVSDCLRVYDRYEAAGKSKCVVHHLRAIQEAQIKRPDSEFLRALRRLLLASLKLQRSGERLPEAVYQRGVASLEQRLTRLLAPTYGPAEEEKVAQRLRNQRPYVFTYLHQPEVAATNNLAERQLRPAVITRKLSCGNETAAGARVWEVLASLAATCRQRGESFVTFVANRLRLSGGGTGLSPPFPA